MEDQQCQLAIVGGGPAGLTAGLYASRARVKTLLLERGLLGGQIINAELVENYPGFPKGISGLELGQLMEEQAVRHGLEIGMAEVTGIELSGKTKIVKTGGGNYRCEAVIIAAGSELARLGVPGEEDLVGRGVSYCATCDGPFFREQTVAVVGGGNAAVSEALFLSKLAARVVLIHRRDQLRAAKVLQERILSNPKIECIWDTVVDRIEGNGKVEQLGLRQVKTGQESALKVGGVFIAVGLRPNTDYLGDLLALGAGGVIPVNSRMETEIPGILAVGDIRQDSIRQVISAAGDGAIAAISAERYLAGGV